MLSTRIQSEVCQFSCEATKMRSNLTHSAPRAVPKNRTSNFHATVEEVKWRQRLPSIYLFSGWLSEL